MPKSSALAAFTIAFACATTASALEKRCGWLDSPTPGNTWLQDKDGEWTIGVQGGYRVAGGDWPWPKFAAKDWVTAQASYGHGCVCMDVETDRADRKVLKIASAKARALSACRDDPALKEPGK